MIKTTSAFLIVLLGQFNFLLKQKEIIPENSLKAFFDKEKGLKDYKGIRKSVKITSSTKEEKREALPASFYFSINKTSSVEKSLIKNIAAHIISDFNSKDSSWFGCCMSA